MAGSGLGQLMVLLVIEQDEDLDSPCSKGACILVKGARNKQKSGVVAVPPPPQMWLELEACGGLGHCRPWAARGW